MSGATQPPIDLPARLAALVLMEEDRFAPIDPKNPPKHPAINSGFSLRPNSSSIWLWDALSKCWRWWGGAAMTSWEEWTYYWLDPQPTSPDINPETGMRDPKLAWNP